MKDFINPNYSNNNKFLYISNYLSRKDIANYLGITSSKLDQTICTDFDHSYRLSNLFLILYNIEFKKERIKEILNNIRVVIDENEDISLINYINCLDYELNEITKDIIFAIDNYNKENL